ncbi:MAG: DUF6477 family protein [Paracoccus sp. (in: a-proteobacteria)]|nr:DUF6477 family protein [Paracoccus sp. (in: a-proteobacteria)]
MTANGIVLSFPLRRIDQPLRRPRLLIRAAREGQRSWRRERDLVRLLNLDDCPRPGACLPRLRAEESMLDEMRLNMAAEYRVQRHVLVMIAILAEMRAAVEAAPGQTPRISAATC